MTFSFEVKPHVAQTVGPTLAYGATVGRWYRWDMIVGQTLGDGWLKCVRWSNVGGFIVGSQLNYLGWSNVRQLTRSQPCQFHAGPRLVNGLFCSGQLGFCRKVRAQSLIVSQASVNSLGLPVAILVFLFAKPAYCK